MNAKFASASFTGLALTFFLVTVSSGNAATYTNIASADAFVATGPTGNLSGNNYGGGGALAIAAPGSSNGEFQSVIQFDLSGARSSLDAQFGVGQWSVQSVTLRLNATPHNNAIYNNIAAGQFSVSLMQDNAWVEGTGTAGIPTTDGVSYNSLQNTLINNSVDQGLGTFSFGGGSIGTNFYSLTLTSGVIDDLFAGSDMTLRLFTADSSVSYLFSSRTSSPVTQPELLINVIPEPGAITLSVLGLAISVLCRWAKRARVR